MPSDAPTTDIGQQCGADADCSGDELCALPVEGWPGGYCTRGCSGGGCPDGSHCARIFPDGSSACVRACSDGPSCRDGYLCVDVDADERSECLPEG